jgi:hypothetical protein
MTTLDNDRSLWAREFAKKYDVSALHPMEGKKGLDIGQACGEGVKWFERLPFTTSPRQRQRRSSTESEGQG